jgi:hypothetical protein
MCPAIIPAIWSERMRAELFSRFPKWISGFIANILNLNQSIILQSHFQFHPTGLLEIGGRDRQRNSTDERWSSDGTSGLIYFLDKYF